MAIKFDETKEVNEDSSCLIIGVVQDPLGQAIGSASITTATYSIVDKVTGATINSRTDIDMSTDIDVGGNISLNLLGADNPIVADPSEQRAEVHIVTIKVDATVSGQVYNIVENVLVVVKNHKYV